MRSDESRVSKSRASSPDGRGVTPPISEPFPINPQTSASPNAGQPLAMQKRVRQTIITQQHSVQLAFFRNAGLSAELCRLAQFLVLEIVGVDLDRPTLRAIVAAAVLGLAEQFLLLRVDRYHRLILRLKRPDFGVDIFELGVAIGMFAAFLGLAVGMAAILQFP